MTSRMASAAVSFFLSLSFLTSTTIAFASSSTRVLPGDSIQAALDSAAASSSSSKVVLASGVHRITSPLHLTPSHSHLHLQGEVGAVIDGGIVLPPFVDSGSNGIWTTTLPGGVDVPTQLFVNGERRTRARSPNAVNSTISGQYADEATFHMAAPLAPCSVPTWGTCPDVDKLGFIYNASDPLGPVPSSSWASSPEALVLVFGSWTAEWTRLGAVFETNTSIMFQSPAGGAVGKFGYTRSSPAGGRWMVENSLLFLDAEGEWYIDSITRIVSYLPMTGETVETVTATVPTIPTLLNIKGISMLDPVLNVTIEGVSFANFGDSTSLSRIGAHYASTAAIQVGYATNVLLHNLNITAGTGSGVLYEAGTIGLTLDRLSITDVGSNGISGMLLDGAPDNATNVLISNCTIDTVGFIYLGQPAGIAIAGRNVSVLHNDVSNVPYGAIQAGWQSGSLTPPPENAYDFEIAYNHVHDYGLGVLSDFGGIYTSAWAGDDCWVNPGPSTGCWTPILVHHNLVERGRHYAGGYGSNGGYMDEGIDGVVWTENVFADVGATNLYFHCGQNAATNNIFYSASALPAPAGAIGGCNTGGFTPPDGSNVTFQGNIVYVTHNPMTFDVGGGNFDWLNHDAWKSDKNVFWGSGAGAAPPLHYPNATIGLPAWRAFSGNDVNSVEEDPQLADPVNGNFTVLPTSPAWTMGWQVIDLSTVGPLPLA